MSVQSTLNKVGSVFQNPEIENLVQGALKEWEKIAPKSSWWNGGIDPAVATKFLISITDKLINHMVQYDIPGPDKKATVINAIDRVYATVSASFPLWMKPFAAPIRDYVINVLASAAIDWIVDKYQNGQWRNTTPNTPENG